MFKLYRVTIRRDGATVHDAFHVEQASVDEVRRAAIAGSGLTDVEAVEQPESFGDHGVANRAAFAAAERENCQFASYAPARETSHEWRDACEAVVDRVTAEPRDLTDFL